MPPVKIVEHFGCSLRLSRAIFDRYDPSLDFLLPEGIDFGLRSGIQFRRIEKNARQLHAIGGRQFQTVFGEFSDWSHASNGWRIVGLGKCVVDLAPLIPAAKR